MAQNQTSRWYFGAAAGLNFMTNPPTISASAMTTQEGCSSIADLSGNTLMYTDGLTVYNQLNLVMSNGTGLFGNGSTTQSGVIVKQPGNTNIYYVFTLGAVGTGSLCYSTVDMLLSAGLGSVTTKNNFLYAPSTEKLTSTRHCNGIDTWVITHDMSSNNFRCYLVTSGGVNPVPVISSVGTIHTNATGYLKASPTGKKLGMGIFGVNNFEIYDFDASTGVVSNPLILANMSSPYGCEFSPDGSKFYGTREGSFYTLYQWDLCAGSNTAIIASQYTIATTNGVILYGMQIAPNGKIYVCRFLQTTLGVINNPNAAGAGCNFVDLGQSIAPGISRLGLPNFITSFFKAPSPPFSYIASNTLGCQTASFNASASANASTCASSGYSLSSVLWDFGDPLSGSSNTSTVLNPLHAYTNLGTYTAQLILNYSCGGGSDTLRQQIIVNQPCVTITSSSITCASLGTATVSATGGTGPYSYTWMPSGQTTSVATNLSPGSYTIVVFDLGNNFTYTTTTLVTSPLPFSGLVAFTPSFACNGANTGTANISLAGGSGNQNYYWFDGITTQTTAAATGLGAGIQTITVVDALTSCSVTQFFQIAQPPAIVLNIVASSPSVCPGSNISFTATASGVNPLSTYTYSWTNGPQLNIYTPTPPLPGNYVYTLTATDANNCSRVQTVSAYFAPSPTIAVVNHSVCPLETGVLIASGATSYTWFPSLFSGAIFLDSPNTTTSYSVVGDIAGCLSQTTSASIFIKNIPVASISSNISICTGKTFTFSASGGATYLWNGPLNFASSQPTNAILNATAANNGVYTVTVTGANSCTSSTSTSLVVGSTPTLSMAGATVCAGQNLNLSASSGMGATYLWRGPNNFTSSLQYPNIANAQGSESGAYNLTVTSAQGCTNSAVANATILTPQAASISSNYSVLCSGSLLSLNGSSGDSFNWTGPNAFSSNIQFPNILNTTVLSSGIYTLVITSGPCISIATKSITVNPLPAAIISYTPTCETKSLQLNASGNDLTYEWTGPQNFTSTAQSPVIQNVSLNNNGLYSVTVTDLNSCKSSSSANFMVMFNPPVIGFDATVCFGASAQLNAQGAVTYSWSGPNGYNSTNTVAIIPVANNATSQQYTVIGTGANTCTSAARAFLHTIALPTPSLIVTPRACMNESITLQGFGGVHYKWNGPILFSSNKQEVTFVASNISYNGTYTLVATDNNGCSGFITTDIIIDTLPQAKLLSDVTNYCVPFCGNFKLNSNDGRTLFNLKWSMNSQSFRGDTFTSCIQNAGKYIVNGSYNDARGCVNTSTFEINAYPVPIAEFAYNPPKPVEGLDEIQFINLSEGQSLNEWHWSFIGNGNFKANTQNTAYTFKDAGTYPIALVVRNIWKCADTIIKTITVEPDFNLFVPNAFTPNDDGENDVFVPKGTGIIKYRLVIFDRWGENVFETDDFSKGWDGSFKGKLCKSEVYTWYIQVTDNKQRTKSLYGHITLYR